MSSPDPASPPTDPRLDAPIARAERRLAMLERLADIGMALAEEIGTPNINTPYHPEPRHDPGRSFAAVSRAVRLTLTLEAGVEAAILALRKGETPAPPPPRTARAAARAGSDADGDRDPREGCREDLVDREDFDGVSYPLPSSLPLMGRGETKRGEVRGGDVSITPEPSCSHPTPAPACGRESPSPFRGREEDVFSSRVTERRLE